LGWKLNFHIRLESPFFRVFIRLRNYDIWSMRVQLDWVLFVKTLFHTRSCQDVPIIFLILFKKKQKLIQVEVKNSMPQTRVKSRTQTRNSVHQNKPMLTWRKSPNRKVKSHVHIPNTNGVVFFSRNSTLYIYPLACPCKRTHIHTANSFSSRKQLP